MLVFGIYASKNKNMHESIGPDAEGPNSTTADELLATSRYTQDQLGELFIGSASVQVSPTVEHVTRIDPTASVRWMVTRESGIVTVIQKCFLDERGWPIGNPTDFYFTENGLMSAEIPVGQYDGIVMEALGDFVAVYERDGGADKSDEAGKEVFDGLFDRLHSVVEWDRKFNEQPVLPHEQAVLVSEITKSIPYTDPMTDGL